jgi:hypothetical protein
MPQNALTVKLCLRYLRGEHVLVLPVGRMHVRLYIPEAINRPTAHALPPCPPNPVRSGVDGVDSARHVRADVTSRVPMTLSSVPKTQ